MSVAAVCGPEDAAGLFGLRAALQGTGKHTACNGNRVCLRLPDNSAEIVMRSTASGRHHNRCVGRHVLNRHPSDGHSDRGCNGPRICGDRGIDKAKVLHASAAHAANQAGAVVFAVRAEVNRHIADGNRLAAPVARSLGALDTSAELVRVVRLQHIANRNPVVPGQVHVGRENQRDVFKRFFVFGSRIGQPGHAGKLRGGFDFQGLCGKAQNLVILSVNRNGVGVRRRPDQRRRPFERVVSGVGPAAGVCVGFCKCADGGGRNHGRKHGKRQQNGNQFFHGFPLL